MPKQFVPTEHDEAVAFAKWLTIKKLRFGHIVNEGPRAKTIKGFNPSIMAWIRKLKSEGWNSGLPDYIICLDDRILFVELKRKKGSHVSEEQLEWCAALGKIPNVHATICKGADEAIEFVNQNL